MGVGGSLMDLPESSAAMAFSEAHKCSGKYLHSFQGA